MREISHDEALEAVRRFENHLRYQHAPDVEDDIILHTYIEQQCLKNPDVK